MITKHLLFLMTLIVSTASWGGLEAPLQVMVKEPWLQASQDPNLLIFETENYQIYKNPSLPVDHGEYYVYLKNNSVENHEQETQWVQPHNLIFSNEEFLILERNPLFDITDLAHEAHEQNRSCGSIQRIFDSPLSTPPKEVKPMQWGQRNAETVKTWIEKIDSQNIMAKIEIMMNWQTRFHAHSEGVLTGEKVLELYRALVPEDRNDVQLELVTHEGSNQKSVRVRIVGQQKPSELVLIGSHLDSINSKNKNFAPGADDNASGTASNLEIFRLMMNENIRPQRSLEFHAYAAEEIGLIGSGEMAIDYKQRSQNVISMLQLDMTGFTSGGAKIHMISNNTHGGLTDELISLGKKYLSLPIDKAYLFFGSSDHASWTRRGFPAVFPTENPQAFNRSIHTEKDTLQGVNSAEQVRAFAQLGLLYLLHYGGVANEEI